MEALVAWLISAAVLAVPVGYLTLQIMALQRFSGIWRAIAKGIGLTMLGLFLFVVWAIVFGQGTMAPMLLIAASPVALLALALLWGLHWLIVTRGSAEP